ncbi:MAG TPA: lysoplasmalogenase [Chryseosolibacter sp.]|nr:lysoplasmalogenase [Chryseosolibacter sp.]
MKKIFLIVFVLVSVGELLSEFIDYPLLHTICKPLIMISLIAYYMSATTDRSIVVIGAMLFSLAGDVLLMNDNYFIAGLVAFLTAHILYIFAYRQHQGVEQTNSLRGVHRIRLAFPILLAGSGLVVVLYPVLGDLKIPVIIYAGVISFMALTALFRYGRTNTASFWLVFFGALLFMISDSILAINRFLTELPLSGFWIMLTYISAQYLIAAGLLRHEESVSSQLA